MQMDHVPPAVDYALKGCLGVHGRSMLIDVEFASFKSCTGLLSGEAVVKGRLKRNYRGG